MMIFENLINETILYEVIGLVLVSVLGGYPIAIVYGNGIRVPIFQSCFFVVIINSVLAVITFLVLKKICEYNMIRRYLERMRKKYIWRDNRTDRSDDAFGCTMIIIFSAMFLGWWLAVLLSHFFQMKLYIALSNIIVGLSMGAVLYWILFSSLAIAISNQIMLLIIFLSIAIALTLISGRVLQSNKYNILDI